MPILHLPSGIHHLPDSGVKVLPRLQPSSSHCSFRQFSSSLGLPDLNSQAPPSPSLIGTVVHSSQTPSFSFGSNHYCLFYLVHWPPMAASSNSWGWMLLYTAHSPFAFAGTLQHLPLCPYFGKIYWCMYHQPAFLLCMPFTGSGTAQQQPAFSPTCLLFTATHVMVSHPTILICDFHLFSVISVSEDFGLLSVKLLNQNPRIGFIFPSVDAWRSADWLLPLHYFSSVINLWRTHILLLTFTSFGSTLPLQRHAYYYTLAPLSRSWAAAVSSSHFEK